VWSDVERGDNKPCPSAALAQADANREAQATAPNATTRRLRCIGLMASPSSTSSSL
jgi:hypothetical protein